MMNSGLPTSLEGVEALIGATRAVGGIMHAIAVVSRAQYALADELTQNSLVYYEWLDEAVARLAGPPVGNGSPALRILLGPERALCGNLTRAFEREVDDDPTLVLVGARLAQSPALAGKAVFATSSVSSGSDIEAKAAEIGEFMIRYGTDLDVELVFPVNSSGELHRELLLPRRRLDPDSRIDTYSPPQELLKVLLSQALLSGRIAHGLAQALRAELGARVLVAQRASTHCDERLRALEDERRVLQKEQVTSELAEVVAARERARVGGEA